MIQIGRLEGFYWVARLEGYAKAARQFPYPISQPGVYQQVRKLEDELGCRLFERVAKDRVRLTPEGNQLFDFCAPFFEALPGVVRSIESRSFGGEIRIDSVGLTVRTLLPSWIRRLHARRPDIRVMLEEMAAPDFGRLRSGDADLIVDYLAETPPWVETRRVGTAHTFLVTARARHQGKKRAAHLAAEPFISYPPDSKHYALQMSGLRQLGLTPVRTLSAATVDSILSFVAAGLGWSLVPWLLPKGPHARGLVVERQTGANSRFPISAAWLRQAQTSPFVEAMMAVAPSGS